jgi:DNA mismatch repair protein MutS
MSKPSPVIQQYLDLKQQYREHLLFFQMGDFYELFFEDAVVASKALDITLTRRGQHQGEDIAMCGVPLHASQQYLQRLIRQGFSVALCEQLETPETKIDKGPLRRDVVRIITPGTLTEENLLDAKDHHLLIAITPGKGPKNLCGLAAIDLSTGDFWTEALEESHLMESTLLNWGPREILFPDPLRGTPLFEALSKNFSASFTGLPLSRFHPENSRKRLYDFFNVSTLFAFGTFQESEENAAGSLLDYVLLTQREMKPSLAPPQKISSSTLLTIDPFTRRNLELTHTLEGEKKGSLISVLDHTVTPAGGRLMALRLQSPLTDLKEIRNRLDSVDFFVTHEELQKHSRSLLAKTPDLDRPLSRLLLGRGGPKDLGMIRDFLKQIPELSQLFSSLNDGLPDPLRSLFQALRIDLTPYDPLAEGLGKQAAHALPLSAQEGGFVATGYDLELDEARSLAHEAHSILKKLEEKYSSETGIASLKVKQNHLVGLFIEVSHTHVSRVPSFFTLKQSLSTGSRYTTPELLDLQEKRVHASEQVLTLEKKIFQEWRELLFIHQDSLRQLAKALALLDVTTALAFLAIQKNYTKPHVDESHLLKVTGGFHPVVQEIRHQKNGQGMVKNDCHLTPEGFTWILTGPNMAGKSTFLRQNALIVLMAQMGSFVPADAAHIGICDRIFSRVGASDNLARGESTFMVEMMETATILRQATSRSFVILDEVGRGTSTHDGLALAWACLEYLVQTHKCRSLFATHYHELTLLEEQLPGVQCYTPQITEWEDEIIFMHRILPGKAKGSYGLHVARLAGIPEQVLVRAEIIQKNLTPLMPPSLSSSSSASSAATVTTAAEVLSVGIPPVSAIEKIVRRLDLETFSPKEALDLLYTLKEQLMNQEVRP